MKIKFLKSFSCQEKLTNLIDRSKRLSERKHKTFLQLNEKDFKNPSGDHQRTNIIWEVQNNELNRQINVITTNTFGR